MSDKPNGDWDENKKFVLRTLQNIEEQIRDVARDAHESAETQHTAVVTKLNKLEERMDEKFVTTIEFIPVRRIVYGLVGIILSGTVIALLALVINRGIL